MAAVYTLKILTDFAAAHYLRDYEGVCNRLHGHNWKVEVNVKARQLDKVGMGIDFKVIKEATRSLLGRLDHYNLNDLAPFDEINPTAENIAAFLYRELSQQLNTNAVQVNAVTLWETDRACVTYTED
ncbi:MAG: 6-carboxytetrahydropterin synthase QueD [Proteobacteria bacterium]|jgi:6-pyruvoyltetrahydropterin/6-carboxytetrahydropterin synthase|nr:6-carboxytetrahydropterin synthase QueD [Pseudomonadota bacterium]